MSDPSNISRRDFCRAAAALLACGATARGQEQADQAASRLRVATFQCDVTPPLGHPIYPSYQPLAEVEQPLMAKGIVLDDGRRRYVLCAVDWCVMANSTHLTLRQKAAAAAGTEASCIAVQTVHQHTAPMVDADAQKILDGTESPPPYLHWKYLDAVNNRLTVAIKQSLASLHPFDRLGTGQAKVERVASSRRIITPDGKFHGRLSAGAKSKLLAELPEGNIDPFLKTITLAQGDKPLVRLHYYATHPQSFYNDPRASIDFPGIAREKLQEEEGVFQVYFTGCAGDVAAGKYNDGSRAVRDELTKRMLEGMKASIAATRFAPAVRPEWTTASLLLSPKTEGDYSLSKLREQLTDLKQKPLSRIRAARGIAFHQRSDRPIELCALHFGRIHILHLPGEPMVAFQQYAQQLRPDDFVAVAGYGEGCPCYICTEQAFSEGGYEPTASAVLPESEGKLKTAIRQLLGVE